MRVQDKIQEIEAYLAELDAFMPVRFDEYLKDIKTKAACERYFEKIIEAVVDLAFLILKEEQYEIPEDDKGAFDILARENVISSELAGRLKDAKGMRNILAHEYGTVDNEIVFHAITEELTMDAKEFLKKVSTG